MADFYRVLVKRQFEGNDMYIVYEDKRNFAIEDAKLPDLDDSDEITFFLPSSLIPYFGSRISL